MVTILSVKSVVWLQSYLVNLWYDFKYILNTGSLEYLPSYSHLKIWNKLPLDLKRSPSLGIFKKSLFRILSEAYISKCNKPFCYSCKKMNIELCRFLYMLYLILLNVLNLKLKIQLFCYAAPRSL